MRKNKKKRYNNNLKRKNLNTVNLSDFSEDQRARLSAQWHAYEATGETNVVSSVTGPSTSSVTTPLRRPPGSNSVIFMIDIPCLASGSPLKRMMPITIQSNLPHIILQFGPDMDMADCPSIRCAVDTCAALSTGNFHFFRRSRNVTRTASPSCLPLPTTHLLSSQGLSNTRILW